MKILIVFLLIFPTLIFSASNKSKKKIKKKRPSIDLQIEHALNTNLNKLANNDMGKLSTQNLNVKTRFKFRPIKKSVLISLPSIQTSFSGSEDNKLRKFSFSHTLLGLFFRPGGNIITSSFTTDYNRSFRTNNENLLVKTHNYSLAGDLSYSIKHNKDFNLTIGTKAKLLDEVEVKSSEEEFPHDYMSLGLFISERYNFTRKHSVEFKSSIDQKSFRQKRSLQQNGAEGTDTPEKITSIKNQLTFKNKIFNNSLRTRVGHRVNRDHHAGAKDYKGFYASVNYNQKILTDLNVDFKAGVKKREFENYTYFGDTPSTNTEKFDLTISNLKTQLNYQNYYLSGTKEKISSNKIDEAYTNYQVTLGINFKI